MKVTKNLTEGNIYRNFLLYALPLILSAILGNLYSTVDAMIAGKFISEHALGAISATDSFHSISHSFMLGFGSGFSVYAAQLFGKRDNGALKRDILNVLIFVSAFSAVLSIISIAFFEPVLDYLNVDPILRSDAKIYFIIYTCGYILNYTNMTLMYTLYALGVTGFTVYLSVASALINIGGNLLSVLVFDLGVAGLAISTVLSIAVSTVVYVYMMIKAFKELRSEKIKYRFSFSSVKRSLRFTIPTALQQLSYHGVAILISPAINALGAAATTGYTVSNKMFGLCSLTIWQITSAVSCYTAQCVGEEKYDKIPRGMRAGFILNSALLLPLVLTFVIFAKPIASLYFPAGFVGEAFEYAVRFSTHYMPFLFVIMIGHTIHAYLRSLGCVNIVFWVTIWASTILVAATLILIPPLHMEGVFMGKIASWIGDTLVSLILYLLFFRSAEQIKKTAEKYGAKKTI